MARGAHPGAASRCLVGIGARRQQRYRRDAAPHDDASIRELLFTDFPELEGIDSINVTTVLKFFRSGHDWRAGVLTDEQARLLDESSGSEVDPADSLSEDEEALIRLLLKDGRMPVAQLARSLGLNVTTTRRRMESLNRRGLMHPRTEVVPSLFGLGLEALVWLRVPMARLEKVGTALAAAPEVKFIAATTGTSQLLANVLVKDADEFYEFLTGPAVAGHEGLEVVESLVVITPVLRGSLIVDEAPRRWRMTCPPEPSVCSLILLLACNEMARSFLTA